MNLFVKLICSIDMTQFGEGDKKVIIDNVVKVIDEKLMKYHIRGTDKYFVTWDAAKKYAKNQLLKIKLPEEMYVAIQEDNKRMRKAKIALNVYDCLTAAKNFVKRWDRIISVENKKRLCEELQAKLKVKLENGNFSSVGQARGFVEKNTNIKRKW